MITAIISLYLAARKVKCIVNKYLPMTLAVSVQHLVLDLMLAGNTAAAAAACSGEENAALLLAVTKVQLR